MERIVHNQLYDYLKKHNFLTPQQFGFRKGRSATHAVTYLSDYIRSNMDIGNCTGAIYIDLRKAFDTVDHGTLLSRLQEYGIKNRELEWFSDYLFNRKQLVQYNNTTSETEYVTTGVPQGSILGPLFFLVHMNDITVEVEKCKICYTQMIWCYFTLARIHLSLSPL